MRESPQAGHSGGETIGPSVERGLGYVAVGPVEELLAFLGSLSSSRRSFLWITDRASWPSVDGGRILRLTSTSTGPGALDPKHLSDLRTAAAAFVADDSAGLVLVDGLESLVLHNGGERVQRTLADLHDDVTMHGGSLVVFVDPRAASPKLVAWLERELDPLPSERGRAREPDLFMA